MTNTQIKIFQDVNVPMLESRIQQWMKSDPSPNLEIQQVQATSCVTHQQPDWPTVTVVIWFQDI